MVLEFHELEYYQNFLEYIFFKKIEFLELVFHKFKFQKSSKSLYISKIVVDC